jgi:hypothetical protein
MTTKRDYYDVLDASHNASEDELTSACRCITTQYTQQFIFGEKKVLNALNGKTLTRE